MPWNLNADRPIFLQILERIRMDIISGKYTPEKSSHPSGNWRRRQP